MSLGTGLLICVGQHYTFPANKLYNAFRNLANSGSEINKIKNKWKCYMHADALLNDIALQICLKKL